MTVLRRSMGSEPKTLAGASGQSLIEVVLVMPLLFAILLGAIEFGRYSYLAILVADAAHAGALYGSQSNIKAADTAGITTAADNDYKNNGQDVSTLTITTWQTCGCDSGGTYTQKASTQNNAAACDAANIDPTTACGTTNSSQSEWVTTVSVKATATFHALFNYPMIPSQITVSQTATMRVDQ